MGQPPAAGGPGNHIWRRRFHRLLHRRYQRPLEGEIWTTTASGIPIQTISLQLMKVWCNQTLHDTYGSNLSAGGLDLLWSCVVSVFLVGGAIGSLGGAGAANKFGRYVAINQFDKDKPLGFPQVFLVRQFTYLYKPFIFVLF